MENKGEREKKEEKAPKPNEVPKKKKTEREVTIAPSGPGGPDISVE